MTKVLLAVTLIFCGVGAQAIAGPETAVLIVDMQEGFLESAPKHMRSNLTAAHLDLLKWARAEDHSVMVFEFKPYGSTIEVLKQEIDKFKRHSYIQKNSDGGFDESTTIRPEEILQNWGTKKVIISGINGNFCVKCTANGALVHGFEVLTAADIVADFSFFMGDQYPETRWWLETPGFFPFQDLASLKGCYGAQNAVTANMGKGIISRIIARVRLNRAYHK